MNSSVYIFKIKCGDVLRRITVKASLRYDQGPDMTFRRLESTIRETFKIPVSSKFAMVYTDKDRDEVTMANDDDIQDACYFQKLNPLRLTVLLQEEESQSSAQDAHPPAPLTVDPPPWAADILLKLDQLLLSINKPRVEPDVASGSPTSTKIEDHFLVVDDSPIDDSTITKIEERFLLVEHYPNDGSTIEPAKDIAQSGFNSEFLRRAAILRQRVMTDGLSEVEDREA